MGGTGSRKMKSGSPGEDISSQIRKQSEEITKKDGGKKHELRAVAISISNSMRHHIISIKEFSLLCGNSDPLFSHTLC